MTVEGTSVGSHLAWDPETDQHSLVGCVLSQGMALFAITIILQQLSLQIPYRMPQNFNVLQQKVQYYAYYAD